MQASDEQGDRDGVAIASHNPRSFTDDRGLTVLLSEDRQLNFIEYVEFNSTGDVRGGHFHRDYTEQFHVLSGALLAEFIDMSANDQGGIVTSIDLRSGVTVTIPPAFAHRFTAREPTQAIAFGIGASPLLDRVAVDPGMWDGN
jgi:dTDP-4-dehydrorhamnose 3,5-epimerase-like enzyme